MKKAATPVVKTKPDMLPKQSAYPASQSPARHSMTRKKMMTPGIGLGMGT